jgi:hypothetical protein
MIRHLAQIFVFLSAVSAMSGFAVAAPFVPDDADRASPDRLLPPRVGLWDLRPVSSNVLELFICTQVTRDRPPEVWDWAAIDAIPGPGDFELKFNGNAVKIKQTGFKRRPIYAPRGKHDLRLGNWLYLILDGKIDTAGTIVLTDKTGRHLSRQISVAVTSENKRVSSAIHVSQAGYMASTGGHAVVEKFAGTAGEIHIDEPAEFSIINAVTDSAVFSGTLVRRRETGFSEQVPPYTLAWQADFPAGIAPGKYSVFVKGVGRSQPFTISDSTAGAFARTFALGMYNQRCGTAVTLPFSRFTHGKCHTAPAVIPDPDILDSGVDKIGSATPSLVEGSRQIKSVIEDAGKLHFPFENKGFVDVSGGYHDAGDYSKYLINSSGVVNALIFAADFFPGVAGLDNLGMPESSDGIPDIIQAAMWEARFISKAQDSDGGFYFLVYPRDRPYEDDVLPDDGDLQVVFGKNTAVTAAAAAALAQASRSKHVQKHFPDQAARFLTQSRKAWTFLENARTKFGKGAYQKITHYGDTFGDYDETAWAAVELYLATKDEKYLDWLKENFEPATAKWGWLKLFEAGGYAVRSCAMATVTDEGGKLKELFGRRCDEAFTGRTADLMTWYRDSVWGTSFPNESKRHRTAGWYFSSENAFELMSAARFAELKGKARPDYLKGALANFYYQAGMNPVNISYITGLGLRWPTLPVSQYAHNDGRLLPPGGIIVGDVIAGCGWLGEYGRQLGALTFPSDGDKLDPWPLYDRFTDHWNVNAEMVIPVLARSLAAAAAIFATTTDKSRPYRKLSGMINGTGPFTAVCKDREIKDADVIWETSMGQVFKGIEVSINPEGLDWIEMEAVWPDGQRLSDRRVFNNAGHKRTE